MKPEKCNREQTRTRLNGCQVTKPITAAERIAALREIIKSSQYAKIDGQMIDLFSASAIIGVYDKLNPANQAKYAATTADKMGLIAFELLKR